jgi:hypothetical protein
MNHEKGERDSRKPGSKLLQSYILSLLSLILCCAMFLNATTAWFTSEVTTHQVSIQVGNLSVDLQDADGKSLVGGTAASLFQTQYKASADTTQPTAEKVTAWEPGAFAYETLQVVNTGNMNFDFSLRLLAFDEDGNQILAINDSGNQALKTLASYFTVWYRDDADSTTDFAQALTSKDPSSSGWQQVMKEDKQTPATLADILIQTKANSNEVVYTPVLDGTLAAPTDGTKSSHSYTVALYMDPDAPSYLLVTANGESVPVSQIETTTDETGEEITVYKDEDGQDITPKYQNAQLIKIQGEKMYLGVRLVANQQTSGGETSEN